ncbi:hypothetical protein EZV73_11535 [Acidaminobacter sp. JC074]|uniref:hypothetical protein n=1 Tax=Acidaminobacter sp. JC074 TaxID=2530199 RepID=UPI001F115F53|nr:hypothetical protein [Acidaminobacter sp. JC074]MCH4888210.1 hypothetical protein [Acidaminobacter sp. JC074]
MNTAIMSAFIRMYRTRCKMGLIYNEDKSLLSEKEYDRILKEFSRHEDYDYFINNVLSPIVLSRSIYHDEVLAGEKRLGFDKYVMVGCGLMPSPKILNESKVVLVDYKEILVDRRKREAGSVSYDLDLMKTSIASIGLSGKLFISMLGLIYYIGPQTFDTLLKDLSSMMTKGSSLVLDYSNFDYDERYLIQKKMGGALDETILNGFDYDHLEKLCDKHDFLIYEHLDAGEIEKRFYQSYNKVYKEVKPFKNICLCHIVKK